MNKTWRDRDKLAPDETLSHSSQTIVTPQLQAHQCGTKRRKRESRSVQIRQAKHHHLGPSLFAMHTHRPPSQTPSSIPRVQSEKHVLVPPCLLPASSSSGWRTGEKRRVGRKERETKGRSSRGVCESAQGAVQRDPVEKQRPNAVECIPLVLALPPVDSPLKSSGPKLYPTRRVLLNSPHASQLVP